MAAKPNKKKTTTPAKHGEHDAPPSDLQRLAQHMQDRPWHYVLGAACVLLAVLLALMFQAQKKITLRNQLSTYASAFEAEKPEEQLALLKEAVTDKQDLWTAEIIYMQGEKAIEAQQYDDARRAFERIRADFSDSAFAPRAVEGLAWLAENSKKFDEALEGYKEVEAKWAESFTGRCQQFNIARVLEKKELFKEAVEAYQAQCDAFPGSSLAMQAEATISKIKDEHPDLFPAPVEEEAEAPAEVEASPAAEASSEAPAEAEASPAAEASSEAPAEAEASPAAEASSEAPAEAEASPAAEASAEAPAAAPAAGNAAEAAEQSVVETTTESQPSAE